MFETYTETINRYRIYRVTTENNETISQLTYSFADKARAEKWLSDAEKENLQKPNHYYKPVSYTHLTLPTTPYV